LKVSLRSESVDARPVKRLAYVGVALGLLIAAVFVAARIATRNTGESPIPLGRSGTLLTQVIDRMDCVMQASRRVLLGKRTAGGSTCVSQWIEGSRVILLSHPDGGPGLRIVHFAGGGPQTPLASYEWSQGPWRSFLRMELAANAAVRDDVEELAALTRELVEQIQTGDRPSPISLPDTRIASMAWPAQCLGKLRAAIAAGDVAGERIWADELAAAAFALADLHRWFDLLLRSHLASLDFQSLCRAAFEWADPNCVAVRDQWESHLPAASLMISWGQNYLEVERQAEDVFGAGAVMTSLALYHDLSHCPAARWMPPAQRGAFLWLRSCLSPDKQGLWDAAAAAPLTRSYMVNILFRTAESQTIDALGLVLERLDRSCPVATVDELMDAVFYRAGLYSSGIDWSDRYDPRLLTVAGQIMGARRDVVQKAHTLAGNLLNGWENYAGGVPTLKQSLDLRKIDCVRGTDLIGAIYRNAGQGEYFVVRLSCGAAGHTVGAVPIDRDGRRYMQIVDSISPDIYDVEWPSAYFDGVVWPQGYPGPRGPLFSAELCVRGLDGYMFAEGYVARGPNAGRLVRAPLDHITDWDRTIATTSLPNRIAEATP